MSQADRAVVGRAADAATRQALVRQFGRGRAVVDVLAGQVLTHPESQARVHG